MATEKLSLEEAYWEKQRKICNQIKASIEAEIKRVSTQYGPNDLIIIHQNLEFMPEKKIFEEIKGEYTDAGWQIDMLINEESENYARIVL